MRRCITLLKLFIEFANSCKQKSVKYMWVWILRMQDSRGKNKKLEHAEFIDMSPLSGLSGINMEAHTVKKLLKEFLYDWLKHF